MIKLLAQSLLLRLGLAMASITALAFLGMLSSAIIAEMTEGAAAAINQAGTLRMQSYRIASSLAHGIDQSGWRPATSELVAEFEVRLHNPRLASVLSNDAGNAVTGAYRKVEAQWLTEIKPILTGKSKQEVGAATGYLAVVDDFVGNIDQLVMLLEDDTEFKIRMLRFIQAVSLFLTLIIVFITMYMMHTSVLTPLLDLLGFAERARRGDFSVRTRYTSGDELGQLGHAFNVMAEDLSKIYSNLEALVAEKTIDLERSNRNLELLYNTISRINEAPLSDATYITLLTDLEKTLGIGPGGICIADGVGDKMFDLASTARQGSVPYFDARTCQAWLTQGQSAMHEIACDTGTTHIFSIPLGRKHDLGVMWLELPEGFVLAPWQKQLIEAVGRHIGMAIENLRRATQGRRLALLEERAVIARELHDSLAQSLSYLKIQITRLQSLLSNNKGREETDSVVQELREGLNGAYRQLRELLTTFRLKVDGRGLAPALSDTVEEFRNRSGIAVTLENHLGACQLSVNEEIHILQIVREALSNVARHAEADHATVTLACDTQHSALLLIDDNGVGISQQGLKTHHYGLVIMQERAHGLGGEIRIESRRGGGTRVSLNFTPVAYREKSQPLASETLLP